MREYAVFAIIAALSLPGLAFAQAGTAQQPMQERGQQMQERGQQMQERERGQQMQPGQQQRETQDQSFIEQALRSGMVEVQAGQLAQQQATNDQVRELGQELVTEHRQINQRLQALARENDMEVPQGISERERQNIERLRGMSGRAFDSAFLQQAIRSHQEAIDLYQTTANSAQDLQIRQFAQETLPDLRDHLQRAQRLAADVTAGGQDQQPQRPMQPEGQGQRQQR